MDIMFPFLKDLDLELGLGTFGPEQNFESTISSSRDKHTHERERGDQSEVNFTDSDSDERIAASWAVLLDYDANYSILFENDYDNDSTSETIYNASETPNAQVNLTDYLSKMSKDPASNLRGRTTETKEHLESSICSSDNKLTLGREQGKWVVNVIDSNGRSTEKHLTINDIKKDTDYKIVLEFGPDNQPEGGSGGLFGMWLGKLCSDHPFGLTYWDWRNVEKQKKDHVWKVIQDKFDFDASNEEYKKSVMKSLCAKAKHYKNKLWRDWLVNKERPKNISEQEWQVFVSLQSTEKTEKLRERNKKSRSHHKEPHKLGTKSFARTAKELVTKTGKLPSRTEIMNCSHQEANGNFVSEEAPHKSVTLKKRKKIVGVESIRNVPIASSSAPHQNPKDDPAMLLTALQQANDKIAALEQSQAAYKQKMQAESEHYEHLLKGVCWIQHFG